uniref:UDP-N-acetylglucosamine 1-carboxyvinyltransferase n=1 Tax=Prochloron didemni P3-Solomon TaxID=910458 RepID=G0XS74_PRODI|nr:UDP-N-acetylglucosamine 1-carboxyvinyltransferase NikO-like protein [Prochloron didemni P3-Solomon]
MLLGAKNSSQIVERVWENRFEYAYQLVRLGARLEIDKGKIIITPKKVLNAGTQIKATDVRGAAVLLLAAIGIEGGTIIEGASHLQRGYSDLFAKLQQLGVQIDSLSNQRTSRVASFFHDVK